MNNDFKNTACIRLFTKAPGCKEECNLGYPNDNRCVAGHPYCHAYQHIPEMKINPSDEYKIKKSVSL